jgi:AbrB family looped-hinge helix DNA binding protein
MTKTMALAATAKVRLNGRITLPLDLREALKIKDGDTVHITVSKVLSEEASINDNGNPCKAPITA